VIRDLGELGLLRRIRDRVGSLGDNDVEYVDLGGLELVVKVDGAAASTSRLPFISMRDWGFRIVASVVSDFLVKLSRPTHSLVSLTLRRDTGIGEFDELIRGLAEGFGNYGIEYVGGDINEGLDDVVDVFAVGISPGRIGRAPPPGDVLVTIPLYGYTGLVLKLSNKVGEFRHIASVARGIEMLTRPFVSLDLLTRLLELRRCIHASMDSSDGLGRVLWTMSSLGNVGIVVRELPTQGELIRDAEELGLDPVELVFNGGEEYLPIFSIGRDCLVEFKELGFTEFAEVVKDTEGVYYGGAELGYRGWEYFKGD
jgi:thiamine-monophosphate kinase